MSPGWLADAGRDAPWERLRVCVAGLGVSGRSAAGALAGLGATVTVVEGRTGPAEEEHAAALAARGVRVRLGAAEALPDGCDLVVTSPGWRPDAPLVAAAGAAGVPVWGEVELAWRLADPRVPWLCVTGTNGKTTTVRMLAAVLGAAGHRTVAAGNVGLPVVDAVLAQPAYEVLAVELSSFQLHWSSSLAAHAAAVLNVAPDHLDWHGSFAAYAAAKARVWRGARHVVFNADDREAAALVPGHPAPVGCTLRPPAPGALGVVDGVLVDRAYSRGDGTPLAAVDDVHPAAPHNVANALAAAALARSLGDRPGLGVPPAAVRDGLRGYRPDAHRIATVATVDGVAYVDDSKATNPHAAAASLQAYGSVVWLAGGLAKGATFDDLVASARERLRAAVLLGRDRSAIREALARHAPDVPVVEVPGPDTGGMATGGTAPTGATGSEVMTAAVRAAARLARPGDTVLLAPACASMDQFRDYAARGDAFAAAVGRLGPGGE